MGGYDRALFDSLRGIAGQCSRGRHTHCAWDYNGTDTMGLQPLGPVSGAQALSRVRTCFVEASAVPPDRDARGFG